MRPANRFLTNLILGLRFVFQSPRNRTFVDDDQNNKVSLSYSTSVASILECIMFGL